MARTRAKRSKKKWLLENSPSRTIGVEKKSIKKKKNKNKKSALFVSNTSLASPSNLIPTPTQAVVSTSVLGPSVKKKIYESKTKRREKNENKPGYIFMCNRKTKPECYRYRVFGLPRGKFNVVKNIERGMKLFLYDFDLKFLYGIYEATSMGALDLEPSAFNGLFPAQVKFNILKDSLPLPESTFRHAIKDNYQGGNKFKQELSPTQVKSLMLLFHDIVVTPPTVPLLPHPIAPPIVEEGARFPPENPYFSGRHYLPTRPPLDTQTQQSVQLRKRGPNEYRSYVAPPIVEEGARFPPLENPYFSIRRYVPARPPLDTEKLQLVQHRECGLNVYGTYVAPPPIEEEARSPPLVNPYFSRHHYLPIRPPHDTEMEQVVQHRECGPHEYQTYVAGLQPSMESKHVVQSEAVYQDKPYYLAETHQPYVPDNPRLLSPVPYQRNLTLMTPKEQDIGGHRTGRNYYSANLADERKPISPVNYAYSTVNFARDRQQPLNLVAYPRRPDSYSQHLYPTTSNASVPAHGAHSQPDLQHLPPHRSYYTSQNPDVLHGGMAQRTLPVSYVDMDGNILVSSRNSSAGVAPSYQ